MPTHNCIRNLLHLLLCALIFLTSGCYADLQRPTPIPTEDPSSEWEALVQQISTDDGIDWNLLDANRQVLERYIAWTGEVGPQSNRRNQSLFPRRGRAHRRMIHFINAYNAWILYDHLERNRPTALDYLQNADGYPPNTRVFVDGEHMSFAHLKLERLLADFQEPRIHVMLYDLTADSPPLQFWQHDTWQSQSNQTFRRFLAEKASRQDQGTWRFHPLFIQYEADFIDWSLETSSCAYLMEFSTGELNRWLSQQASSCELIPFDINRTVPQVRSNTVQENSP